jgi:phenylalanine-4-hydroxylase
MHTNKAFAETLVRFGECARTAAGLASEISRPDEQMHVLSSMIRAMARFFWFTIEFGLMRCNGSLKAYGSGLLSSFGELEHAVESKEVQRYPLQLEWVVNQPFEINHFQPLLFIADSFEHVYSLVGELDDWLRRGKLDNVAPGEPAVNEQDLKSFLMATTAV